MNRGIASAIGGVVVGILLYWAYQVIIPPQPQPQPRPPLTTVCPSWAVGAGAHCINVSVIAIGQQPVIQDIPDEPMGAKGFIYWILNDPTYTFPSNGIDFVTPGGDPDIKLVAPSGVFGPCGVFVPTPPPPPPAVSVFRCHNNQNHGTWAYRVTVSGSPAPPTLDPFIVNN